jgi:cryptochrome
MWVSSSAFEKLLDSSSFSIIAMAYRLDRNGTYIKRYVPELRKVPSNFIHEPWKMSTVLQESVECVIGHHYPQPIIDLQQAMKINSNRMKQIRESLVDNKPHVRPSNEEEIRTFFWIADKIPVKC